jgi:predicted site-specific integrase-resolvase
MKAKEVLRVLRISRQTLYNYKKSGKIKAYQTYNSLFNYDKDDVFNLLNSNIERKNVIYCRVSTKNQRKDLQNQKEIIEGFCNKNGILIHNVYLDIASGLNFDRDNFQALLNEVINYKIDRIFITYRDRLSRISFNMFKQLFSTFGTEIIILNDIDNEKLIEKEIFQEIIDLIHCFTMKIYSQRRKEKLKLIEKQLVIEKQEIDEEIK